MATTDKRDRLGMLRVEARALFGKEAPRVAAYGKTRVYPMYDVMTMKELETALQTGILPEPSSIAAMNRVPAAGTQTRHESVADVPVRVPAPSVSVAAEAKAEKMIDSQAVQTDLFGDEAATIARALQSLARKSPGTVDEGRVREIVAELMAENGGGKQLLSVQIGDLPRVDMDGQHEAFPILLAVCAARVPCMLVGPAGSGKTSGAEAVAEALSLSFYCMSVGPQTSKSDLLGFRNAMGEYQGTPLREAYENGGVFLLDEIDAGNPGVLTVLNAALANGGLTFADGVHVKRHADFVPVAAANTFGTGADRQYVGRNQLDAATLDRFYMLEWGYDEAFEAALVGVVRARTYQKPTNSGMTGEQWLDYVASVRKSVTSCGIRHIVSPRATIYGARLLNVLSRTHLEEGLIWKGLPKVQREQVTGKMGRN
jgi:cobaltochelatase CobS